MCCIGHGGISRTHIRSLFGEKSENWFSLTPLNKTVSILLGSVLSEITYADLSGFRCGCIKALRPPPFCIVTTRLSRVTLWVNGFSFSPCIQRVSAVLTSFRNLSPATRFSPFSPYSFSVWAGILCFLRTGSDTRPVTDILSEQSFSQMTVFWGCFKTSNDLKNHPFSQTKSRSQVSGSDIYSDFQHRNHKYQFPLCSSGSVLLFALINNVPYSQQHLHRVLEQAFGLIVVHAGERRKGVELGEQAAVAFCGDRSFWFCHGGGGDFSLFVAGSCRRVQYTEKGFSRQETQKVLQRRGSKGFFGAEEPGLEPGIA